LQQREFLALRTRRVGAASGNLRYSFVQLGCAVLRFPFQAEFLPDSAGSYGSVHLLSARSMDALVKLREQGRTIPGRLGGFLGTPRRSDHKEKAFG
jgi:hypothetical protein